MKRDKLIPAFAVLAVCLAVACGGDNQSKTDANGFRETVELRADSVAIRKIVQPPYPGIKCCCFPIKATV